jgi:TrmH family RNA methyltransferase
VVAALDAGLEPVEALVDGERPVLEDRLSSAELVDPPLLADVSTLAHPPRLIAVFERSGLPVLWRENAPPLGLALWHVADPGNVGTLIRTAAAFGPAFVALSSGCADPLGAKALRASMGAVFVVPLGRMEDAPRPWVALQPRSGVPLPRLDLEERATFVLGAEREGLPDDIAERCDAVASIPLSEAAESLNVAVAGAIALYELVRRRLV